MLLSTEAAGKLSNFLGMSMNFWVVMLVLALFLTAILTSSYNDDKTKGL